jgi:DNA polymerase-3 subunit delta
VKYTNSLSFEKHLEASAPDDLALLYLLHAKEDFIKKQAVNKLTSLVLGKAPMPLSLQVFDAQKHSVEKVLEELGMLRFLTDKRMIVVENVDALDKAALLKLEPYITAVGDRRTFLVLTASSLHRASQFYKSVEKQGTVLDIAEEKPWEKEKNAVDWLLSAFAKEKKQVALPVAQLMVKQIGTDQTLLHAELSKLICYVGEKTKIEESDLSAICCLTDPGTIWQLGEALFMRETLQALRLIKGLLADGAALIALLRQLRSQFQTACTVCSILQAGGSPADIAQKYPYMKGQILDRQMRTANNYGFQRLKKGLLAIDEAELEAKNSNKDPEFLAERLVLHLTL